MSDAGSDAALRAPLPGPDAAEPTFDIEIRPSVSWARVHLGELWAYRELLYFLVWRDIKVRYKQTVLGVTWAVIQPVCTMLVFSLFFGRLAQMPSDDLPYPLFAFAALVPWSFFAAGLGKASDSLLANANLVHKVYFPRLVIPIAAVLGGCIDFVIAFVVLLVLMAHFDVWPTWNAIWLPAFMALTILTALAVGLWMSALTVRFRDVRYTTGFLVQLWFFSTPIAYPSALLSEPWRTVYGLNPMAGVADGFRWALLDGPAPGALLGVSTVAMVGLLVTGALYFRRMERTFADTV